jgi:hypothetical protein
LKTTFTVWALSPARAGALVVAAALVLGANALLRAQTSEFQLVPSNAVPQSATFISIQLTNLPPLPWNPYPQLDVYGASGAPGWYWVDDRLLDYGALRQQRQVDSALRSMESQYGLASAAEVPPDPGGWDGSGGEDPAVQSGPPVFTTSQGLCLWPPVFTSSNSLSLTLTNVEAGGVYDLLYTTNLAPLPAPALCRTNWAWLGRGCAEQGFFTVTNPPQPECYFILGNAAIDTDGDGLPDAYENLVSHTSPSGYNIASSDGYGTPDGWYLDNNLNPQTAGLADLDSDRDGLPNRQEYLWGSDPQTPEGFVVWVSSPGGGSGIP